jgi:hypothetical protein
MPKPMHATKRLSFDGAVDADGHILEPPDLWETHLEAKYRDRALRLVPDEHGLEELEIGGERSRMSRRGFPSTLGAMGDPDLRSMQLDPEKDPIGARRHNDQLDAATLPSSIERSSTWSAIVVLLGRGDR